MPTDVTFTGQVRVGDSVANAITLQTANLLASPVCFAATRGKPQTCFTEFRIEDTEYRDPTSGHLVAEYGLVIAVGDRGGRPVSMRGVMQKTLDRQRSRGW